MVISAILLLIGGCASKKPKTPILTKTYIDIDNIKAPRKIGVYELDGQKDYREKNLGIALRYVDKKRYRAYLDAFIYPKESGSDLEKHYKEFIAALKYMKKEGKFKSFKIIKEDEVYLDSNTKAKRALFEITGPTTPYYSVAYLAEADPKHYFKVRVSNQLNSSFLHGDLALGAVKELFRSLKISK
jgi:hypothetical protein